MQTILLCGKHGKTENISLKKCAKDHYLIDIQISALKKMGFDITVVLDKEHGDEILSKSKFIKDCDLVYDTNNDASLYSNLKSALYSVETLAFVVPVYAPLPIATHWNTLLNNNFKNDYKDLHFVQTVFKSASSGKRPGYPLFITKSGYNFIKESKGIKTFQDQKLIKSDYIIEDQISNFNEKLVRAYIDNPK